MLLSPLLHCAAAIELCLPTDQACRWLAAVASGVGRQATARSLPASMPLVATFDFTDFTDPANTQQAQNYFSTHVTAREAQHATALLPTGF